MKKSLVAVAVALALSPLATFAQEHPYYGHGYRRSPWYIGFGIGTGFGTTYYPGGVSQSLHDEVTNYTVSAPAFITNTSDNGHLALNFKVGATLTPQFLLGFDVTTVRAFGTVTVDDGSGFLIDNSSYVWIWNFDLMATFFPFERGLFFRAGMGPSFISSGISVPFTGTFRNYEKGGFNGTLGVGYAFWLTQRFNLTLNADFSHQWYGGSSSFSTGSASPESSSIALFWVGFDFY